jgi:hypothetical protein
VPPRGWLSGHRRPAAACRRRRRPRPRRPGAPPWVGPQVDEHRHRPRALRAGSVRSALTLGRDPSRAGRWQPRRRTARRRRAPHTTLHCPACRRRRRRRTASVRNRLLLAGSENPPPPPSPSPPRSRRGPVPHKPSLGRACVPYRVRPADLAGADPCVDRGGAAHGLLAGPPTRCPRGAHAVSTRCNSAPQADWRRSHRRPCGHTGCRTGCGRCCTGLAPATSAPGLGSPLPHLRRDWAHPSHIRAGTGLTPPTSAPGLGPSLPHLRRDWAHPCPHLRRDWARPAHICAGAQDQLRSLLYCLPTDEEAKRCALFAGDRTKLQRPEQFVVVAALNPPPSTPMCPAAQLLAYQCRTRVPCEYQCRIRVPCEYRCAALSRMLRPPVPPRSMSHDPCVRACVCACVRACVRACACHCRRRPTPLAKRH